MKNNPKTEKKLRNYRVIFKDGSEIEFQAAGLKEAENTIRDMQKDPEELIELLSSPIEEERPEGPEGERCEEIPAYSKEDLNQMLGTSIGIVGDHIRILNRVLIPHLSDDQKEEIEKAFHYLEKHASEENVFICIYDAFADTEEVSIVEFTKTAKDTPVVNATSFLAITKVIAEEVKRVIATSQLRKVFERIACNPDPISFPGENA